MFGRTDHLEMLLSITVSHPANERFEFNAIWHTTNKWLWEGWQVREPGGSEGLLVSMLCWDIGRKNRRRNLALLNSKGCVIKSSLKSVAIGMDAAE